MGEYRIKPGKIGQTLIGAYQTIEGKFVDTFLEEDGSLKTGAVGRKVTKAYRKVEDTVVSGYQKMENGVVGGYRKVEQAFVDTFLEPVDRKQHPDHPQ